MTSRQAEDLLAIAHVARTHGVRGEVSVTLLAPSILEPEDLLLGRQLLLRPAGAPAAERTAEAESIRPHQARWLVKLKGIDTLNEAETLRGYDLCLSRGELPELPEGWYWEADLLRCRVIDAKLGDLGRAAELDINTPQPQLVVRRDARPDARIPWVRAFVNEVNLDRDEIRINLPDEFPGISD